MKWLGGPSPFHLFTNPCVINRFIFGQGVVIYYIYLLVNIQIFMCILLYMVFLTYTFRNLKDRGPVVQNILSLTTSLRRQLVKYMATTLSNTLVFFVEKNVRIFCTQKIVTFFQQKIKMYL